jgi:hypothetical protein
MKRENFRKAESIIKELQDIEWWLDVLKQEEVKVIIHYGKCQMLFSQKKDEGHLHDQQHTDASLFLVSETSKQLETKRNQLLTTFETL